MVGVRRGVPGGYLIAGGGSWSIKGLDGLRGLRSEVVGVFLGVVVVGWGLGSLLLLLRSLVRLLLLLLLGRNH